MRIVRESNTTLMWIARKYLGDVTQWKRIAKLNKRFDPYIHEPEDIMIPDPVSTHGNVLNK